MPIEPVGGVPSELLVLAHALRNAVAPGAAGPAHAHRLDPVPVAPTADSLRVLLAAGPPFSATTVLPALKAVLQESITAGGGLKTLVKSLVAQSSAGDLPTEPDPGLPGEPGPGLPGELRRALPRSTLARAEMITEAIGWLVENLDRPSVVATGCAQQGPALAALGVPPARMESLALALASALLPNTGVAGAGAEWGIAWQETGRLVARWMAQGAATAEYQPPLWLGTVVGHDLRRQDLAVVQVRTYLPYPCQPGQYAIVESDLVPETWRRTWVGTVPAADNGVELHVRCGDSDGPGDPAGYALVGRIRVGDRLRLGPPEGSLFLEPQATTEALLVAIDTGVAPMKALLAELRLGNPRRQAHLFWLVAPNEEPYDRAAVLALADPATKICLVSTIGELAVRLRDAGLSRESEIRVAGPPTGVAAALTVLAYAGFPASGIRSVDL